MAPRVRRVASVCTGAFILAAAGLLNHRRVTTHWMFSGEGLSVSALADRMGMSPRNFARVFHSETGNTPAQFTGRARADAARCKLEQTTLTAETIAEECGFRNTERMRPHFSGSSRSVHTTTARGFDSFLYRGTQ
jgi:transcriptional regulator GlxA family with amidase domain